MKRNSLKYAALGLAMSLCVPLTACSNDKDDDKGGNIADNKEITITPERDKLLRNPLNGWVIYAGLGDGLSDRFWEEYDNMPSSAGTVRVADYGTTLYIRGAWSDFNPEEGKYVWDGTLNTKPAQRFRILEQGAKERNLKLAFTFVVDSRDKHYNFTPQYVQDAGAQGRWTTTGSVQVWSPFPDDPIFQRYYEKFVKDFAAKYDDPDVTQFVSGQGLGKWGEYHSVVYSTNDQKPREAVFEWATSLFADNIKKVPVVINYHRCIGTDKEWITSETELAATEKLLMSAYDKGYSFRHDAFGMKSYYQQWEKNFAAGLRFKRPIIMEGGWVWNSHGNSPMNQDGYKDWADVRRGEFTGAKEANANMMDLRYNSNYLQGETWQWFNTAYDLVQEFISEGGYRLYPNRLSLPENMKNGSDISIIHRWINLGWGYCPTNIPQWKDKYKIAFALLDKTTLTPQYVFVDNAPELSTCVKGSPQEFTSNFNISGVTAGTYTWAIGVVDTTKDNNQIGIQISAKSGITDLGWLQLFDVAVK